MDTVDRNYVAYLIDKARRETATALYVANSFQLAEVMERLDWTLYFLHAAAEKLPQGANEDGTFGPSHITDTGRELREPPQG